MNDKEKILFYFKEISKIPRASGDEKKISDYLIDFAKKRNLEVYVDECYNVIIKKPSTLKGSKSKAVILQGHTDMVYVKNPQSEHIYENGIDVLEKDGYLYADGTTLGGDNGVAVAYMLTLLDSRDIIHPDLEVVITAQEETGLVGAQKLDCKQLRGKYLLNLDAENEGVFFTSCAGGLRNHLTIPLETYEKDNLQLVKITIKGLKGGHSGVDINEGRASAIKLMARLLKTIVNTEIELVSLSCDGKANTIPNICEAEIAVAESRVDSIVELIKEIEKTYQNELQFSDTVIIEVDKKSVKKKVVCYDSKTKSNVINALELMPFGVLGKSFAIENLVETSVNIGAVEQTEKSIIILSSVRSSIASRKQEVLQVLDTIAQMVGGETFNFNNYPQWVYEKNSPLRDIVFEIYEQMYHKKPISAAIHAGLECGYFDEKIEDIDIISFGANLIDVHTTKEKAEIQSVYNIWDLIVAIVEKLAKSGE